MRTLIALFKILCFIFWCLLCVPPQFLVKLIFKNQIAHALPYIWHKGICFIFSIKVITEGEVDKSRPLLYAVNHFSYLDIPVLGSQLMACFIAKKEVAGWPVFGFLAKLQNTAFIDRRMSAARKEMDALKGYSDLGKRLILFPEGTSTKGKTSIPFRSNFFEIAVGANKIPIQPVSLLISKIEGDVAQSQSQRDQYAWYGDMDMAPHLWEFCKSSGATIRLVFHPPFLPKPNDTRKDVALQAEQAAQSAFIKKAVL